MMLTVIWMLVFLVPAAFVAASAWRDRGSLRQPGGFAIAGLTVLVIAAGLAALTGIGELQSADGLESGIGPAAWGSALLYAAAAAMALVRVRLASSLLLGSALVYSLLFLLYGRFFLSVDRNDFPMFFTWLQLCVLYAVPALLAGVLFRFAAWQQTAAQAKAMVART